MFCLRCHTRYPTGARVCTRDASPLTDRVGGRYELEAPDPIVAGRFLAIDHDGRGARVAIRVYPDASDVWAARVAERAAAVAALDTPNVVALRAWGHDPAVGSFVVSERIEGVPLDVVMRETPAMALDRAVSIVDGALRGLAAAHAVGIVHGGLTARAIVLAGAGSSEVAALVFDEPIARDLLDSANPYMAPERFVDELVPETDDDAMGAIPAELVPGTDIYAMGVILYELVSGRRLSEHEILGELSEKPCTAVVPPLTRAPEVAALVARCLAPDPARRPGADHLRAELAAATSAPHATTLSVEAARSRLLAACDDAYQRAFARSARAVRTGILGAQGAIRATPAVADVRTWLADVCEAIAAVRAAVRDDEDGFELGGIATVRNLVEDLRDELSR